MTKKQEPMMLGFNQAGMEQSGKIGMKLFAGIGVLFGLLMMIFIWWLGLLIVGGNVAFWYAVDKSKPKKR